MLTQDASAREPMTAPARRTKRLYHELSAEVLGCIMIIVFGNGVTAAWIFSDGDKFAKANIINMAWAIGIAFGILVSYETSGAVLNSALMLNAMVNRGFPWCKGFYYMLAQLFGSFLGAVLMTINFVVFHKGDCSDQGVKDDQCWLTNFYSTAPGAYEDFYNAAFNEMVASAVLCICFDAITTGKPGHNKFIVAGFGGLCVYGIGNVFGPASGYAINPTRDFGPRLCYWIFAVIYGYEHVWRDVFGSGYFLVPLIAPYFGCVIGGFIYKHLIYLDPPKSKAELALEDKL